MAWLSSRLPGSTSRTAAPNGGVSGGGRPGVTSLTCQHAGDITRSCSDVMKPRGIFSWPRWAPILVVLALAALAIVAVRSLREPVLRAAGWALVVNEPVASADIIALSLVSGGAGVLEAAAQLRSGRVRHPRMGRLVQQPPPPRALLAMPGANSSTSLGPSCRSDCATGRIGSDQRDLIIKHPFVECQKSFDRCYAGARCYSRRIFGA